ncbi:MAG TPA: hypothetical protein VFI29_08045, partial [Hanamia sp.]|nr:hypothetical protein [Hanamia sp.]
KRTNIDFFYFPHLFVRLSRATNRANNILNIFRKNYIVLLLAPTVSLMFENKSPEGGFTVNK